MSVETIGYGDKPRLEDHQQDTEGPFRVESSGHKTLVTRIGLYLSLRFSSHGVLDHQRVTSDGELNFVTSLLRVAPNVTSCASR